MQVRTRIAPSPTGNPHVGTLFQALINYVYAKRFNGKFIWRVEDTDRKRFVEGAEEEMNNVFVRFNLEPDEGPIRGGKYGPYKQSQRLDLYKKYADILVKNDFAYPCFCSKERLDQVRKNMQSKNLPPMYDKHCRSIPKSEALKRAQEEPHVIRMKIPDNEIISFTDEIRGQIEFDSNSVDDQVIIKSDGFPTYHLAVVVDDHLMKISHIVRGEEWTPSTPKHVLLYKYLNWQMPKIVHTPVLRNPDKSKLSKRHGHASVSWYIEHGYLEEAIINFLATRVWNHPKGIEVFSLDDLIRYFDFKDMHIQGPIFDLKKLDWFNGIYIRNLSDDELLSRLDSFIPKDCSKSISRKIIPLIKERLVTLSDFESLTYFIYRDIDYDKTLLLKKGATKELVKLQLETTRKALDLIDENNWTSENIEKNIRSISQEKEWKPSQYFMMLRIAVTGEKATPPLFETISIIGKEKTINRLEVDFQ